jgi:hypothetical protein
MKDMNANYHLRFFAAAIAQMHELDASKYQPEDLPQVLTNVPITRLNLSKISKYAIQFLQNVIHCF